MTAAAATTTLSPLPSRYWADLSTRDFAQMKASGQAEQTVAVLPVAAIEQHGPHLPLSVDATLLQGVIDAALPQMPADLPVLFLPPQNVGLSEIGECVARAGIKKLLLFNGHGGQVSVMDIVARELRTRCDLIVYSASWFSLPLPDAVAGQFSAQEHRFGIHAGEIETSMMLHLAPDTVHMGHARDFRSTSQDRSEQYAILGNGKSAKLGWQMQDYHPAGAVGNAAAATADKGQAVVEAAAGQLVALLQELAQLPLQTLRPETE
ncbi:MAG: creatininase family protein [Acidovorax sp.]|nr:MAG: creatininase family protein [Acidovorax sp.]